MARFGLSDDYPTDPIEEAPDSAAPTVESSALVLYPKAIGDTGNGDEKTVGKPTVIVGRPRITGPGYWWYYNYWANTSNIGQGIWLKAYDPTRLAWAIFTGKMKRPTHSNVAIAGDTPEFTQFQCIFTDLVFVELA